MGTKLENYIAFNDNKIKQAKIKRDKMKIDSTSLTMAQKKKLTYILSFIRENPESALRNKSKIKSEIERIISN